MLTGVGGGILPHPGVLIPTDCFARDVFLCPHVRGKPLFRFGSSSQNIATTNETYLTP